MRYTWKEVKLTPITDFPSDEMNKTGGWRTFRPVIDYDKCIRCWICWKFCPDAAVHINKEEYRPEIDYEYCKGCGICANECPKDAITMEKEV
ncbi:MAG: 4Fe-4S binding protein [Thermoplasmata archaeon]|nr:4Fe-4S binding protein [Thermoplasmata archaeon]